jgi:UDP-glucose-4-epimerase GalE
MQNILVVGGAGYIGSHACKALAKAGYRPIAYDNLSRGHEWAVKWGPLVRGNIADKVEITKALEDYRPAAIMHFAAFAYVGESNEFPLMYYENNVCGTASLLRATLDHSKIPIVFSSSCATYGIPTQLPISESHFQNPVNPYGRSKLFVEHMLRDLHAAEGLRSVSLRYFNAAGADPDGEIGESHDPETHLIPATVIAALTGAPVRIFGTDYETPDGTCIRDFVHVADIAEAHVSALKYLLAGGDSIALNLANEKGHSVRDVIAATEKVCGAKIKVETVSRRPGDPAILIGDASKAESLLRWRPARSELEAQIRDATAWLKKNLP